MDEVKIFDGIQTLNYLINNPNFHVVSSYTRPTSPKENTVWINSYNSNWVYSMVRPDDAGGGWDWIQSGLDIGTDMQILPNNGDNNQLYSYPIKAYSCNVYSGMWSRAAVEVYMNGQWITFPEGAVIIDQAQLLVKAENWLLGASQNSAPVIYDFVYSHWFSFSTKTYFYQADWAICKTVNLSTLNATKLIVTWDPLSYNLPFGTSWDTNTEPGVYISLFRNNDTWKDGDQSHLLHLHKKGGSQIIDLTKYESTIKSFPFIGIFVGRSEGLAGATVPMVTLKFE